MTNYAMWAAMTQGMLSYNNHSHDEIPEKKQKYKKVRSEAFSDGERRKRTKEKKRIKKQKNR